jgi:NAD-dependent SIR2 family protein deacetylase
MFEAEMDKDREAFLEKYLAELRNDNAAVFVGAGLSKSAGFVDWIGLLEPVARQLGLDSKKESDLVGVAQFHVNANGSNRSALNQLLIDNFSDLPQPTENHNILARLPIRIFWTTNYDRLVETSLIASGIRYFRSKPAAGSDEVYTAL